MSGSSSNADDSIEKPFTPILNAAQKRLLWAVAGVSIFINLLMLTGPIFMLQVYDRVLSSRSEATLVVLLTLVAFLYLILGMLDHARARIASRVGAQIQHAFDLPVFSAGLRCGTGRTGDLAATRAPQDLSLLQQVTNSPVFMALFDIPWIALFLIVIALLHPLLGAVAAASAAGLAALGIAAIRSTRATLRASQISGQRSDQMAQQIAQDAARLGVMGTRHHALERWRKQRETALTRSVAAQDHAGPFGAGMRAFRLFLQSLILATGAWLVLRSELSPGAMIAASILLGRALAPLDQLIGGWPQLQAAHGALARLRALLDSAPIARRQIRLPTPHGTLSVKGLSLRVHSDSGNRALLHDISFEVRPGQALGVIGPSGAGKTMLADAIMGVIPKTSGDIRLGDIQLEHHAPSHLARAIGFLPQRLTFFESSLRDNIARLDPDANDEKVIAAAQIVGAHGTILSLPQGYDTSIRANGGGLSGGQAQRIALARAFFGEPGLLVLDEPDAGLDDAGTRALNRAIRTAKERGAIVLIMAHRPAAIAECDLLMKLDHGQMVAFGPAREVLCKVARNSADILRQAPYKAHPISSPPLGNLSAEGLP